MSVKKTSSRDYFSLILDLTRNKKESSVLTVMDFESCYERIWRAGLLKKAAKKGIGGRLWLFIRNFLMERKHYIKG